MKSKMNLKPIIVLIGTGLCVLVAFQNCAKSKGENTPQYGRAENSSVLSSETDLSVINMPILPEHFESLTEGSEIYGNCTIANNSRDFTLVINDRSGKKDCATKCNDNVRLFSGDKVTCTFPGGTSNASIETAKNYCRIVVDESEVKLDSYALNRDACISQCQIVGRDMDKAMGLKCEWQNRLLYYRVPDKTTPIDLGSCSILARNSNGIQIASLNYASGTTEASCSNIVTKIKEKFSVDDVTFQFTKVEYVTIQ